MRHSTIISKKQIKGKAMVISSYLLELRLDHWLSDLITIIPVNIKRFVGQSENGNVL
jgi:hypothetical protein